MAILSVDLAYRRWSDLGVVILDRAGGLQSPASAFAGMSSVPPPLFGAMGQRSMAPRPIACEVIPMAWEAVSYTHLDVYKRQIHMWVFPVF